MTDPGLYDPLDAPEDDRWHPFNMEAAELAACLEACRQISDLGPLFDGKSQLRAYTVVATQLYNLIEHTLKLHKLLVKGDRSGWPPADEHLFIRAPRRMRRALKPIKRVRDKRSAHLDLDGLHPGADIPRATPGLMLPALRDALQLLILCLNYNATYSYYRIPDGGKPFEVEITAEYPVASMWRVDERGRPVELLHSCLAVDPRHEAQAIINTAIDLYNRLAQSSPPQHPPIFLIARKRPERDWKNFQVRLL